ncbi:hypothetical protein [Lentzea aerocolonigenes]|uniref:hypothetical protein n=1 Tax=Lentzea aerocolonigenes TaxID=68170 RepID=UPI0004C40E83|nr:hypothetical protein [Lentzea aerocolonigenes]MCP2244070.1 hypothetical protein [Lentzea aerocolonigenes]
MTAAPATAATARLRPLWTSLATWSLAGVLVAATLYGLLSERAYRLDRVLQLESMAQDVLTLAIVPVFVWAGHRGRTGSLPAHLLWLGLLGYVAYTYVIYAFGVPHNSTFLLYVVAVMFSLAALVDGIPRIEVRRVSLGRHVRTGWFLIVIGVAFAGLWLSDIVPSIGGGLPATIGIGELPYPVYVLDLAIALPAITATGVALVRGHVAAPVLGAVVLIKILTLGLAIWAMAIALLLHDQRPDWPVAGLFAVVIAVCTTILWRGVRQLADPAPGWLRPALWE